MQFDRHDICEAYYLFAAHWHGGQFSKEYRIFGRLEKIKFRPTDSLRVENLSDNGREIYQALVRKKSPKDYEACGECGFDHSYEPDEAYQSHASYAQEEAEL